MSPGDIPSDPWPVVERALARVARRNALSVDEAEDFTSWARVRLLESGGAPFARFRGESTFERFVDVVVTRLFLDYRVAKWGKWRPSAAARRLGPVAILLDRLVSRDGLSERDAVAIVRSRLPDAGTPEAIERMLAQLPVRVRPRFEPEEAASEAPIEARVSERGVVARELAPKAKEVEEALRRALARFPAQDRLVLKLRFQEGLKIVDIAQAVGVTAKSLYPRIERCVVALRRELESSGIEAADAARLLDWDELDLTIDYQVEDGEGGAGAGEGRASRSGIRGTKSRRRPGNDDRMSV